MFEKFFLYSTKSHLAKKSLFWKSTIWHQSKLQLLRDLNQVYVCSLNSANLKLLMLPFIAPILAILGFSLMFPTRIYFTSVTRSLENTECRGWILNTTYNTTDILPVTTAFNMYTREQLYRVSNYRVVLCLPF